MVVVFGVLSPQVVVDKSAYLLGFSQLARPELALDQEWGMVVVVGFQVGAFGTTKMRLPTGGGLVRAVMPLLSSSMRAV